MNGGSVERAAGEDDASGSSMAGGVVSRTRRVVDAVARWGNGQFFRLEHRLDQRFDRQAGIETVGTAHLDELTIESEHTDFGDDETIYKGIPVLALRDVRRRLPDDLTDHVFVDYGSGKGRVVCWAATLRVRRVIGVEFAAELHAAAVDNLERFGHRDQWCDDLEVVHADATEFELPGQPCVLYFFKPFEADVLAEVVDRIRRSYLGNPRSIWIWYHNPAYLDVFGALEGFEEVWARTRSRRSPCYEAVLLRSPEAAS